MKKISAYMSPDLVTFVNAETRDDVLRCLVDNLLTTNVIDDKERFFQAIIEREKIVSTGVGMGVAIPHAKLVGYDHFFIAIGILQKPVDWDSLDGIPVRLVFMVGGPDDKQTEYLQILSHLTHAIKKEEIRKKLLNLNNPHSIIELFYTI